MAYFAKVEDGVVTDVLAVHDNDEHRGHEFLSEDLGLGGTWIQTSYNTYGNQHKLGGTPFRYNFASVGYTWDETKGTDGAFIPPSPFPSWVINENTFQWEAPISMPEAQDGIYYNWDEETVSWIQVTLPSVEE